MAFGAADISVSRPASVEERVIEVTLRRMDGKRGVELDVIVTVVRAGKRVQRRLTDEQVDALWNATGGRTFKNWVMQQIIAQAK